MVITPELGPKLVSDDTFKAANKAPDGDEFSWEDYRKFLEEREPEILKGLKPGEFPWRAYKKYLEERERVDKSNASSSPRKMSWQKKLAIGLAAVMTTGTAATTVGDIVVEQRIHQVQQDLYRMNPEDAKLIEAGAYAYGLLYLTEFSEENPWLGKPSKLMVQVTLDHWLDNMRPESRAEIAPVVQAFRQGQSSKKIEGLIQALVKQKVTELQGEFKQMPEGDAQLLQAGMAAQGLLIASYLSDQIPQVKSALENLAKEHKQEWLKKFPESAQKQVEPILDAFIQGKPSSELEKLITDKATYTPSGPTKLKDINVNDPKTPGNMKQLKNLINDNGVDGRLIQGDKNIHFLYVRPAVPDGPVMLMANGKGASISSTANLILEAQKRGMGIMLPEYSGNGESTGPLSEADYFDSVQMALTYLVADEGVKANNILMLGYSMGTFFASKMAAGPIDLSKFVDMRIENNIDISASNPQEKLEQEQLLNSHYPLISPDQFKRVNLGKIILVAAPMGFKFVFDDVIKKHEGTEAAAMSVNGELLKTMQTILEYENGRIQGKKILFVIGNDDSYVNAWQPETLANLAKKNNAVAILRVPGTHTTVRQEPSSLVQIFNAVLRWFNLEKAGPYNQISSPFTILSAPESEPLASAPR